MLPSKPQPWFLALLLLAACGAPGVPDAGAGGGGGTTADAGKDAGTPDAGNDAGVPDAGTPDAGAPDAGALDAGAPDAGAPDAGVIDAGYPDNCTSPSDLVFPPDGGSVTFVANMNGANDEYVGSCHTVGNGPDLVYRIVLSQAASLRISSVGASGTALFYLRQSQCVTGPEVACAVAPVFGGTATRFIGFVPAGTYFLFIDSYAFTFGQQTVTVTAGPPASTPGDSCAAPLALFPDGGRSSAFVADTTGLGADMQGTCGGSGPEAVYHFALTAPADLDVLAVNDAGPRPIVYLRQSNCLTGIQVACRDLSINFSPIGHFFTNNLPAGDYYLVVDSSADGGTHAINADLKPPNPTPANDLCTSPQVLPGAGSYAGSTIGAGRQVGLSCLLSEADVFYSLTLTSAQDIGLRVSSTKPGFRPIIGLRATTCQSADLGCAGAPMPGTAAELTAYNRQPGTYLIIVSGQTVAPDDGTFTLDVTLSPPTLPPSNDTCTTPVILFADGGTIDSVATNLAPALGQHRSACTPGYGSNDVVYGFATTTPQRFHAALSTDAGVQPR